MAHSLKVVDSIRADDYNSLDTSLMLGFINLARAEMQLINEGVESFFRDYAATNDHEFFAIAVENLFERPDEFRRSHPQLFQILVRLLNQERVLC
jgi:Mlc titration factor MtfA (ptsG expression regulator)